jgi:hydrogenase maturation protein HypF
MAGIDTIVVSGGVFQNELLVAELVPLLRAADLTVWANHLVPPNDGGISLGQAAIAACGPGA